MKTTKKLIAFAAALSMSACMMAMPMGMAWADGTNSITINDSSDGYTHTGYVAYQVFTGTYDENKGELTITDWGDGVNSTALITALKNSSIIGSEFSSMTATGADAAKLVAEKISTYQNNSEKANEFARIALRCANTGNKKTANNKTISNLDDGYYVVADSAAAQSSGGKGFTLGLLVAGGQSMSVTTKIDYPKVVKKVKENTDVSDYRYNDKDGNTVTDADYNDIADYNIGDSVPFKLYGTMPSNLDEYSAYYYKFTDTLAPGLTPPEVENVKVYIDGNEVTNPDNKTNMRVKVIGQQIAVSFEDIKEFSVTKNSVVTVVYSAVLNSSAAIGLNGNENTVHLSYLNNPNVEYKPDTSSADTYEDRPNYPDKNTEDTDIPENKDDNPNNDTYVPPTTPDNPDCPNHPGVPGPNTPNNPEDSDNPNHPNAPDDNVSSTPEDKVIVFTYELDVTKKDAINKNTTLQGAVFTLKNSAGEYAKIDDTTKAITWVSDTTSTTSDILVDEFNTFSKFTSGSDGLIEIKGLDAGKYTLTEIQAPTNYNDPGNNNSIEFTIAASQDANGDGTPNESAERQNWNEIAGNALTELKVTKTDGSLLNSLESLTDKTTTGTVSSGKVAFDIYNTKGATLPSTGGMGTTIFLLTGGIVAGGAAVLYITRKRASAAE